MASYDSDDGVGYTYDSSDDSDGGGPAVLTELDTSREDGDDDDESASPTARMALVVQVVAGMQMCLNLTFIISWSVFSLYACLAPGAALGLYGSALKSRSLMFPYIAAYTPLNAATSVVVIWALLDSNSQYQNVHTGPLMKLALALAASMNIILTLPGGLFAGTLHHHLGLVAAKGERLMPTRSGFGLPGTSTPMRQFS
jgi:hypothetical protein